ncbi:MAG: rhodanese-like domain-containing protein [Bdellovibrionales bacterium]
MKKELENIQVTEDGVPEIRVNDLHAMDTKPLLIDVRTSSEYSGELGHIADSEHCELGPDLEKRITELEKEQSVIFVCRSGKRSANATLFARQQGIESSYNMQGGMLEWNESGFPIVKES